MSIEKIAFQFDHNDYGYLGLQVDADTVHATCDKYDGIVSLKLGAVMGKTNEKIAERVSAMFIKKEMDEEQEQTVEGEHSSIHVKKWGYSTSEYIDLWGEEEWLVKDIIGRHTKGIIFGAAKSGKSFIGLSLAMSIAYNYESDKEPIDPMGDWYGHKVECHGQVFYITGEGNAGISKRLRAIAKHTNLPLTKFDNLIISKHGIKIDGEHYEGKDTEGNNIIVDGVTAIENEIERHDGFIPDLIVIDTMVNAMSGDENSTKDANTFLSKCSYLMKRYKCSVLIIHHVGRGSENKSRARGSSVIDGDVDFGFLCKKDEDGTIILTRPITKDDGSMPPMAFTLKTIPLGLNKSGESITSAVLVPTEVPINITSNQKNIRKYTAEQKLALAAFNHAAKNGHVDKNGRVYTTVNELKDSYEGQRAYFPLSQSPDAVRKGFKKALEWLKEGIIIESPDENHLYYNNEQGNLEENDSSSIGSMDTPIPF